MPHVIVKFHADRSETVKAKLAEELTRAVMSALNPSADAISVAIEDVKPEHWTETVYKPDVLGKRETIYKKPGYNAL